MQVTKELDILNPTIRKQILDEIKATENVARKQEYLKRYDIYKDNTKKHVINGLVAEGLKPTTIAQMSNRAGNISICRKIINKKARAYSGGVQRNVDLEAVSAQVSELSRLLAFDLKMKKSDRYRELYKNTMLQLVPEIDLAESLDGSPRYKLKLSALAPWQYDVVEDPFDRERALAVIVSDFSDRPATPGDTPTSGKDEKIADHPSDAGKGRKEQYIWWSTNYHFTTDETGEIIAAKSPENLANPIQMLPFANNAEDQDGQFWAQGGEDLVEGSILVNKLMTDMNFIAYLQGFGQLVVTGKNIQEKNFSWGPNNACLIEYAEEDPIPSVQILSANPPLDQWMQIVQQYIALLLTTNNLSSSTVSANLSVDNFPSGIAMLIEQAESTDSLTDKQKEYVAIERQLWEMARRWLNLYADTGTLCAEFAEIGKLPDVLDIAIKFIDAKPATTEAERLENIKRRKDLGINEQVDLIMIDNPDMTREEAQEKLLKIQGEKLERMDTAIVSAVKEVEDDGEERNADQNSDTEDDTDGKP